MEFLWGPILLLLLLNLRSGMRANGSSKDRIICIRTHARAGRELINYYLYYYYTAKLITNHSRKNPLRALITNDVCIQKGVRSI